VDKATSYPQGKDMIPRMKTGGPEKKKMPGPFKYLRSAERNQSVPMEEFFRTFCCEA